MSLYFRYSDRKMTKSFSVVLKTFRSMAEKKNSYQLSRPCRARGRCFRFAKANLPRCCCCLWSARACFVCRLCFVVASSTGAFVRSTEGSRTSGLTRWWRTPAAPTPSRSRQDINLLPDQSVHDQPRRTRHATSCTIFFERPLCACSYQILFLWRFRNCAPMTVFFLLNLSKLTITVEDIILTTVGWDVSDVSPSSPMTSSFVLFLFVVRPTHRRISETLVKLVAS